MPVFPCDVTYPGLGTISIDDPKELLKLVTSFSGLLTLGKQQSTLIDKTLTSATIGAAINDSHNNVFSLQHGDLTDLSRVEWTALTTQLLSAVRVIDFSHFDYLAQQPDAHFVVQLTNDQRTKKHWLHLDRYNGIACGRRRLVCGNKAFLS